MASISLCATADSCLVRASSCQRKGALDSFADLAANPSQAKSSPRSAASAALYRRRRFARGGTCPPTPQFGLGRVFAVDPRFLARTCDRSRPVAGRQASTSARACSPDRKRVTVARSACASASRRASLNALVRAPISSAAASLLESPARRRERTASWTPSDSSAHDSREIAGQPNAARYLCGRPALWPNLRAPTTCPLPNSLHDYSSVRPLPRPRAHCASPQDQAADVWFAAARPSIVAPVSFETRWSFAHKSPSLYD